MKPGGSRKKGSAFELSVAKELANVLGIDQKQYLQRSPDSGARDAHSWKGDIVALPPLDKHWPFFIECKKVEGWTLDHIFSSRDHSTLIHRWYQKAREQAMLSSKIPLVIFSRNRAPVYIAGSSNVLILDDPWEVDGLDALMEFRPGTGDPDDIVAIVSFLYVLIMSVGIYLRLGMKK